MEYSPRPAEGTPALSQQERRQERVYLLICAIVAALSLVLMLIVALTREEDAPVQPTADRDTSIIVAGQPFDIGAPVITWNHDNGYDAYNRGYHFAESLDHPRRLADGTDKLRFNQRAALLTAGDELTGEDALVTLRETVDLFVIHYDVCGVSRQCFKVLHDIRGYSVHFMLDVDGHIYQTLDLKERAWHAGDMNDRSIGIEIANPGAYASQDKLNEWYTLDETGYPVLTLPEWMPESGILTPDYVARPARPDLITGTIHGRRLMQYDFTDAQYEALIHLVAGVNRALPRIAISVPRDNEGNVRRELLSPAELRDYHGLIAHWHFDTQKVDPGPAFDWERVIHGARALRAAN